MSIQGKIIALLVIFTLFSPLIITGSNNKNPEFEHVSKFESNIENEIIKNAEQLIVNDPPPFIENRGQLENENVRFYSQSGNVWFTDDGVWFEIREYVEPRGRGSEARGLGGVRGLNFEPRDRLETPEIVSYKRVILKQEFVGANLVKPIGREQFGYVFV